MKETKSWLRQSGKKVCRRFINHRPEEHAVHEKYSFNKAFAIALYVAAGSVLPGCSSRQDEVVGKQEADSISAEMIIDSTRTSGEPRCCESLMTDTVTGQARGKTVDTSEVSTIPKDTIKRKKKKKPQEMKEYRGVDP